MSRAWQVLASLVVVILGSAVLWSLAGPWASLNEDGTPLAFTPVPVTAQASQERLGVFEAMSPTPARATPRIEAESRQSESLDEAPEGAAVNLLYSTPQGERWMYPTNGQHVLDVGDLTRPDGTAAATLIQLVGGDRAGDGRISAADGVALVLTGPDPRGGQVIADGLVALASLSQAGPRAGQLARRRRPAAGRNRHDERPCRPDP